MLHHPPRVIPVVALAVGLLLMVVILFSGAAYRPLSAQSDAQATGQEQTVQALIQQFFTETAQPTRSASIESSTPVTLSGTPVSTIDAAAYDFSTATVYRSTGNIFAMRLPAGWTPNEQIAHGGISVFAFSIGGNALNGPASIQFQLADTKYFYANIDTTGKANTPQTALQAIIDQNKGDAQSSSAAPKFTPITDVKVGKLAGKGTTVSVPASAQAPETYFQLYLVQVDPNTVLFVQTRADVSVVDLATPVFDQMIASVVINAQNVPTATVTQTEIPLMLTATSLQATITALTPANSPTAKMTSTSSAPSTTAFVYATNTPNVTAFVQATDTPIAQATRIPVGTESYAGIPSGVTRTGPGTIRYPYDVPYLGNPDAPVKIEEIGSFSCPFCQRYHDRIFLGLLDEVRAGNLQYLYLPTTLTGDFDAAPGTIAFYCAAQQSKFGAMQDRLFQEQPLGSSAASLTHILADATAIKLDISAFSACRIKAANGYIKAANDYANGRGLVGTPTIFLWINGHQVASTDPSQAQTPGSVANLTLNELLTLIDNGALSVPTATDATTIAAIPNATVGATTAVVLDGKLHITDTVVGTGVAAKNGDTLTVSYTGKFTDGTVFDSTAKDGGTPFTFQLGAGQVIAGWEKGLIGMKVGGKRTLVIPPDQGYGAQGQGPIPANATLIFDVELIALN